MVLWNMMFTIYMELAFSKQVSAVVNAVCSIVTKPYTKHTPASSKSSQASVHS